MANNKLFGTDGIRGTYGQYPLDKESIYKLGHAIGTLLDGSNILLAMDTRESGPEILEILNSGIAGRTRIESLGILPTPGLSYSTRNGAYDYGIMITASHNPFTDNGIKLFNNRGEKISPELEQKIQDTFFAGDQQPSDDGTDVIDTPGTGDPRLYTDFLLEQAAGLNPQKQKIVLDCGHGATYRTAPWIFESAGYSIEVLNTAPDGKNINRECGSTHPDMLAKEVSAQNAHLGIAFDGDGDRVIFIDNQGNILDGDHTLFAIAPYLKSAGFLTNDVVVGTVVGNLGLEKALEGMGIKYIRAQVGDKHVYRQMLDHDAALGGEQSGHTIIRTQQPTGDGILTALYLLKALQHTGQKPTDIYNNLSLYPQITRSITIKEKKELSTWDELNNLVEQFNQEFGEFSRVLIRYSGTEPKVRVMLESREQQVVEENINKFEKLIKSTIGV